MFKNCQANLNQHQDILLPQRHEEKFSQLYEGPFLVQKVVGHKSKLQKKKDNWTQSEHIKYVAFLSYFDESFFKSKKVNWDIYKLMAKFIRSRNPNQCRIHHILMLKQHQTLGSITSNLELDIINYRQKVHAERSSLQLINQHKKPVISLMNHVKVQAIQGLQNSKLQNTNNILYVGEQDKKIMKEDNIRTDDIYHDQDKNNTSKRQSIKQLSFLKSEYLQAKPNRPHANFNFYDNSLALSNVNVSSYKEKTQKDWQQCHELFIAWTCKLKKIMESE